MDKLLHEAAQIVRSGGVVACPTEAVWGLSCAVDHIQAIKRILAIKCRPVEKGLLIVAADIDMLGDWVDWAPLSPSTRQAIFATWPGPVTWVMPASKKVLPELMGSHKQRIAVRITAHPVLKALSQRCGMPLVSTSANLTGHAPVKQAQDLHPQVVAQLDMLIPGEVGILASPTQIRDALTQKIIR